MNWYIDVFIEICIDVLIIRSYSSEPAIKRPDIVRKVRAIDSDQYDMFMLTRIIGDVDDVILALNRVNGMFLIEWGIGGDIWVIAVHVAPFYGYFACIGAGAEIEMKVVSAIHFSALQNHTTLYAYLYC